MVLVGYWSFDDDVLDRSGYGHNGTVVGTALYTAAKKNDGFNFNDTTYINLANADSDFDFDFNTPFSVMGWIMPSSTASASFPVIINKVNSNTGWQVYWSKAGKDIGFKPQSTASNWDTASNGDVIQPDTPAHIACTYAGQSNRSGIKIYVNKALNATGTAATPSGSMLNNTSARIGADAVTAGNKWRGWIDELRVYSHELSQDEINQHYDNSLGKITATAKAQILRGQYKPQMLRANCKNNALRANCKVSM